MFGQQISSQKLQRHIFKTEDEKRLSLWKKLLQILSDFKTR
eukprot:UN17855